VYRARRGKQGQWHYQKGTAKPKQPSYKRCAERCESNETGGTEENPIKTGN